jgi:hypothetical protein
MVDFTSTQAQSKELAPPVRRGVGQVRAVGAISPSMPPPLTTNRVDRMYIQLAEIHFIAVAQLAECGHWHQTDSTPRSVRVGMSRPRPGVAPSAITLAPSPYVDFMSQAPLWPW